MKVLLTGASGQLGQALRSRQPAFVLGQPFELIATSRHGSDGVLALDLSDAEACKEAVRHHRPDWVINAGAYTAVDLAESEPALAEMVNAGAPLAFAKALKDSGGRMLQLSTDFVFSGNQGHPYRPEQQLNPLGVYGASKAAGEMAVQKLLGCEGRAVVLRTSWLYGPLGNNFLLTMLRLHHQRALAAEPLCVVADQVGCPTATLGLADACWTLINSGVKSAGKPDHQPLLASMPTLLHWSDAGVASWYDFAVAIGDLGQQSGLLKRAAEVQPISTAKYPTPAKRPSYSLLDCSLSHKLLDLEPKHWRLALQQVMLVIRADQKS
ncbi:MULTISPECIES: dTDP-4-dehydrorhamnose reductase [unclassified Prochlorococcus]|uniref:dTDP-4-dehydrorhamnose reductase n=1 Tax=unclassified Prochlorococcus TaxID=2627481 RepID=UPI0005339D33|nr:MULTISPECIES: dTDP-4-dehydrorhamnose reductase [unclassified Prochlorococcus]KGG27042.1 dTDP-4-dehydrorhamnose reductase [Prochlorococcus sp. MIT 0701]KGG27880.1 dTDP-4-dehydrorhamnose reductase [Prochlorococcus sp. MIT 0702]KGG31397.1 dTDP-4-dehydrorhamnose reductase [Prochlorococcus sp. MIT 0703]